MSKFAIDYLNLENTICKKAYRLDEVKDRIEKVAFDIVKFKDNDHGANLWQIQSSEEGDYIVAIYEPENEEIKVASWDVKINKISGDLQVSYKGDPIVRVGCSKLGIPRSELSKVEQYLPQKLADNKRLVKALLNELDESAKNNVFNKYPELV